MKFSEMTGIFHLDRIVAKVTSSIGIGQNRLKLGFWELELRIGIGIENPA